MSWVAYLGMGGTGTQRWSIRKEVELGKSRRAKGDDLAWKSITYRLERRTT